MSNFGPGWGSYSSSSSTIWTPNPNKYFEFASWVFGGYSFLMNSGLGEIVASQLSSRHQNRSCEKETSNHCRLMVAQPGPPYDSDRKVKGLNPCTCACQKCISLEVSLKLAHAEGEGERGTWYYLVFKVLFSSVAVMLLNCEHNWELKNSNWNEMAKL